MAIVPRLAACLLSLPVLGAPAAVSAQDVTRGYSAEEITNPIPLHSSISAQPTFQRLTGGSTTAYLRWRPILVVDEVLPLFTRVEWPLPQVDDQTGPTHVGIGDLTWLTLFPVRGSKAWGTLGAGPVFVFPTATFTEMGQGKYQLGPALGYVNQAVRGWQFAFLAQQFFSFAGSARRTEVNQLTLQPIATRYFPGAWYLEAQPTITLDFENGTSSVPVALTAGKVVAGHWNFSLEAVGYPPWTAPPSKTYELRLTIGYHFPAF